MQGADGLIKDGERSDISCTLCMAVMQLLDETITDPTNEQQVVIYILKETVYISSTDPILLKKKFRI